MTTSLTSVDLTVVVPTCNEASNVRELVRRLDAVLAGTRADVLFVDDSTDGTADVIREVALTVAVPVRVLHRDVATGGLGGAVVAGLRATGATWCVVMDGDLQHPPEMVPRLVDHARAFDHDIVVASRYVGSGSSEGLSGSVRMAVSAAATALTRAMFPVRLRECSDPMTGFFAVRREAVDLDGLRPRGFKILLEILARDRVSVGEVPFVFGERHAGESKATVRQGLHFIRQLASLRFGRMSRFAAVGAVGAVVNVALVALLTTWGMPYVGAAVIGAEVTIVGNFVLLERLVFADLRQEGKPVWRRFLESATFNNVETLLRLPVLVALVESAHLAAVPATAITLLVAFLVRFVFHARIVYRPRASRHRARLGAEVVQRGGVVPPSRARARWTA